MAHTWDWLILLSWQNHCINGCHVLTMRNACASVLSDLVENIQLTCTNKVWIRHTVLPFHWMPLSRVLQYFVLLLLFVLTVLLQTMQSTIVCSTVELAKPNKGHVPEVSWLPFFGVISSSLVASSAQLFVCAYTCRRVWETGPPPALRHWQRLMNDRRMCSSWFGDWRLFHAVKKENL